MPGGVPVAVSRDGGAFGRFLRAGQAPARGRREALPLVLSGGIFGPIVRGASEEEPQGGS